MDGKSDRKLQTQNLRQFSKKKEKRNVEDAKKNEDIAKGSRRWTRLKNASAVCVVA